MGGGGVTSTVPDLLRLGARIIDHKLLSEKWHNEMLTPVTTSGERWSGIGDADE